MRYARKVNSKISKNDHITTSYRSFQNVDEELFLDELSTDLETLPRIIQMYM